LAIAGHLSDKYFKPDAECCGDERSAKRNFAAPNQPIVKLFGETTSECCWI
jgi:hypothetical protein